MSGGVNSQNPNVGKLFQRSWVGTKDTQIRSGKIEALKTAITNGSESTQQTIMGALCDKMEKYALKGDSVRSQAVLGLISDIAQANPNQPQIFKALSDKQTAYLPLLDNDSPSAGNKQRVYEGLYSSLQKIVRSDDNAQNRRDSVGSTLRNPTPPREESPPPVPPRLFGRMNQQWVTTGLTQESRVDSAPPSNRNSLFLEPDEQEMFESPIPSQRDSVAPKQEIDWGSFGDQERWVPLGQPITPSSNQPARPESPPAPPLPLKKNQSPVIKEDWVPLGKPITPSSSRPESPAPPLPPKQRDLARSQSIRLSQGEGVNQKTLNLWQTQLQTLNTLLSDENVGSLALAFDEIPINSEHNGEVVLPEGTGVQNGTINDKGEVHHHSSTGLDRYGNILQKESTAIRVGDGYLNGTRIEQQGFRHPVSLTQGPTAQSAGDHWVHVFNSNVSSMMQVTGFEEKGKVKCFQYFAPIAGEIRSYQSASTNQTVTVTTNSVENKGAYTITQLTIECGGESKQVSHFHFTQWPDHGVPSNTADIINFVTQARSEIKTEDNECLIHCSAGVGRTGVTAVIQNVMDRLESGDPIPDPKEIVEKLREYRGNMVQTPEQYQFVFQAVRDLIATRLAQLNSAESAT